MKSSFAKQCSIRIAPELKADKQGSLMSVVAKIAIFAILFPSGVLIMQPTWPAARGVIALSGKVTVICYLFLKQE